MAHKIIFTGSKSTATESVELQVYSNTDNLICIDIQDKSKTIFRDKPLSLHICLDVGTAIKFSKELRKSISEIKDGGK